jgi:hypothetical protein
LTDSYDNQSVDNADCPTNGVTGTYTFDNCKIILRTHESGRGITSYRYGGALTTSSTPTTGGPITAQSPSVFVGTAIGSTVTFASRKNYVGFWWSAGSLGNAVNFYRGSTLVATMTGDEVYTDIPNNSTSLTALNNSTTYTSSNYYGHPLNRSSIDAGEPFVYIHVFAVNGFNFDKVTLSATSNGFEYDNLTVANLSTSQLAPKRTLVFIKSYNYTG